MSDVNTPSDVNAASPVRGPWFDELEVGAVFDQAPPVTITEGMAALHHGIVGNRLRLALDHGLAAAVTGTPGLVSPALVWDVSIGQSTGATQKVRANLFYRNLRFLRFPRLGDTLRTVTTVDALRGNTPKPGRPRTGMAALHIVTTDQDDNPVLDYWRCAMLPASPGHEGDLPADDLSTIGVVAEPSELTTAIADWDLASYRASLPPAAGVEVGQVWEVDGADVVSSAPELARLTGNLAAVHHDAHRAGGRRLVYGGHTIGLALHHLTRALPSMVTVLAWHSCDHLAPVHEDDALTSTVEVTAVREVAVVGQSLPVRIADVRVVTSAASGASAGADSVTRTPVLDWHLSVALP